MKLDIESLRALRCVAEHGGVTRAASHLSLTQSAVSHSIRALEEQLACKLLDRSRRKVQLTPEGIVFLKRCRRVMQELDDARKDLESCS